MRSSTALLVAVCALVAAFGASGTAAQSLDPLPRPCELIFGWDTQESLDLWAAQAGAELNTDAKFVRDGAASAKVDFSGQPEWSQPFSITLDEPMDWSKYGFVSVDVYVPAESVAKIQGGDTTRDPWWHRIWLNAGVMLGERDVQIGQWNRLFWAINPDAASEIRQISFGGNIEKDPQSGFGAYIGPLYFDNFRGYTGSARGLGPGEVLIAGFNDEASTKLISDAAGDGTGVVGFTSNSAFKTEGDGALVLNLQGINGWNADFLRPADPSVYNLPKPVDLSGASSVLYDVYIPPDSAPSWYNVGIRLQDQDTTIFADSPVAIAGWNTFVAPIPDSLRDHLHAVDKIWFLVGSGGDDAGKWKGPIYIDAVRAVVPAQPVVKGDLNGDGKVTIADATLSLKMAVGLNTPDAGAISAGDVNGDGKITIADTTLILRKAVGLTVSF